ncbi:MAG: sulfatase-like hydrolase/transferase [Bacteroidales bacterium]|nr:sulfatase-like hydrolase/transferase [Bacteroidales bacterium]
MNSNYVLLVASFFYFMLPVQSITGQDQKPNIIFILTDDQAPWALGASGDPNASTPNMDRLAHNGAYFKNAFITTPVCSPSRASIMTSRYASEYGILDFIPDPNHRLYNPDYNPGLDPESITFAEVLQKAGYKTGLVGKWHLGDWMLTDAKKFHPTNHGFDYFMGLTGGGTTPDDPELEKNGKVRKFQGLTTDILTDYAMQFIKSNADKSFLLCLNTRAPHGRWLPVAKEDWVPFENMDPYLPNPDYPDLDVEMVKRQMREYLASTRGVDRNLDRIIALCDELGLTDHTIIIFFSDHGYNMGHNGIKHKGNGIWMTKHLPEDTENILGKYRPNMYDNSLKVPAFVYWSGVIKPGTVIHHTITSLDLYPTIVEMAGAELPDDHIVRGRSFVPLLKGEEIENWDDNFYGEYSMINYCDAFMRCYRTSEWKLVRDFLNPERDELYNIAYDPQENINLIHDPREEIQQVIENLHLKILQHMEDINDPLLDEIEVDKEYYK